MLVQPVQPGHNLQTDAIILVYSYAAMAQPEEHLRYKHEVVGLSPTWDRIFSHVCAHFGILGWCGIILPRFWLWGQLEYRIAFESDMHDKTDVDVDFR